MSGSVCVFPIQPDGFMGEDTQFIQHAGSGVNPTRQQGPHAHTLVFLKDGAFAFFPALSLDKLTKLKFRDN